jgi:HK97 family phage major capsid protein
MLLELRDQRKTLSDQAAKILTTAATEKRAELKGEEEERLRALYAEVDNLTKHIQLRERQEDLEAQLALPAPRIGEALARPLDLRGPNGASRWQREDESREAMRAWFLAASDKPPQRDHIELCQRMGVDLANRQMFFHLSTRPMRHLGERAQWEYRAQATTPGAVGGFTIADEMMQPLEVALLTFGGLRSAARVIRTTTGADLPWPMMNDTAQKGVRLAENAQVSQQDIVFTQLVLQSFKYSSKMILVSVEFLQDSSVNVPEEIGRLLGERIGRITNEEMTTGTGTAMPLGVVTASTVGKVGLAGQVATVIYDDLVDLEHSVDPAYRGNAQWMFHDTTLRALKKLKNTQGEPLWLENLRGGAPATILGYPYVINQEMPVMAANAKSILFGDFSKYLIRDIVDVTILRLDERFADYHQVAFLAFSRHDGDLLDAGTHPIKHYANPAT